MSATGEVMHKGENAMGTWFRNREEGGGDLEVTVM